RRQRGAIVTLERFARSTVRAVIERVLASASGPCWLRPPDLETILHAAGIDVAGTHATAVTDAVATAERLGYPLVAKVISPGLLHKSDVGGVIMGVDSAAAVATAVETLQERMRAIGAPLEGILLQRQVAAGIEALVGVTTDPTFGPLLVCG